MKKKLAFGAGLAVGYVLGARAGRQRYDQLVALVQSVWTARPVADAVSRGRSFLAAKLPGPVYRLVVIAVPVVAEPGTPERPARGGAR